MMMKSIWPVVSLAAVVLVCVTVLLAMHVDPTAVISVIAVVVTPIITAVTYAKVETISQQTNGQQVRQQALLESLVDHVKRTQPPVDENHE